MRSMLGRLDHMPIALRLANQRAERWRQRYMQTLKERDALQKKVDDVTVLYNTYMKWDGERPHPGESSPRQREDLARALGIEHVHQK